MANAIFVNETYIKDKTPVAQNVDFAELAPHIEMAQELYVQPALGSALYKGLMTRVSTVTLTSDDTDLLALVRPWLANKAVWLALPFLNIKIRNRAVLKASGEFIENADLRETDYLRNEVNNIAEFHEKRLKQWLCDNGNKFSEYQHPDANMPPSHKVGYDFGFIVPNNCNSDENKWYIN